MKLPMRFSKSAPACEVIVHADDFGITEEQSRRILECARPDENGEGGSLNSLSVMVTSPAFPACASLLRDFGDELLVGLHVNIVEGRCAAAASEIPLLVDGQGTFNRGFGGVLVLSVLHPRVMRRQVAREVGAQIELFIRAFPERAQRLRIDSHQHFHMIPAVFDGLVQAVDASGCAVEHIRIPAEPLAPFVRSKALGRVAPINWVKHGVLNALWRFNKRKVEGIEEHSAVFCGINFSGCMTLANVQRVAGAFKKRAEQRGVPLELLFHPGGIDEPDACLNPRLTGFVRFYTSPARRAEAKAAKYIEIP